jgi:hypothetical protein
MAIVVVVVIKAIIRARTKIKARILKHCKTLNYRLKY